MQQRTIGKSVSITGVGLHSGRQITLNLMPSTINTGIQFVRSDLKNAPMIAANAFLVKDTLMSSNLQVGSIKVGTVEHLLAAIAGLGIDNLLIAVSGIEIPIMDGSASAYIKCLLQAGVKEQTAPKQFLRITKKVRVTQDDKWAEITPHSGYTLTFNINFDHPAIPKDTQQYHFEFSSRSFLAHICQARTFGFIKDIEFLKKNNLALGGSLNNAIVLDDKKVINETGLRYPDEFVRHKILDAVGDLYLAQYPLIGHFKAYKSGHALNNELVRAILNDKNNFEIVTFHVNDSVPIDFLL